MEKESKELKAALTGQKIEPVMASAKKTTPIKKWSMRRLSRCGWIIRTMRPAA